MTMLSYDFMQRALIAAIVVGLTAPLIGVFLVQRRLALLGDGMGHVALTGVGLAFLVGTAPLPTALVVATAGAILLEVIRLRSRTAGDVALALVFYGGIAGGVLLTSLSGSRGSSALNQYLFGSLSTISMGDLIALLVAAAIVLVILGLLGRQLFVLSLDPDLAHVQGLNTTRLSMLLTVLASITVVLGMRTVGLLLISAIMIVPIAAAQQLTGSFRSTAIAGIAIGIASCALGLGASFSADVPPGPTIVLLALACFAACALAGRLIPRRGRREPAQAGDANRPMERGVE